MKRLKHRFAKTCHSAATDDSGIAAVEFALIAPVLILLVVITYDIGMVVNDRMAMEDAALTSARYVFQGGDIAEVEAEVTPMLDLTDPTSYAVTAEYQCECDDGAAIDCDTGCSGVGSGYMRRFVNVETSMDHQFLFPYPGMPDQLTIEGGARLQVE